MPEPTGMNVVVEDVSMKYGENWALSEVSLSVAAGEIRAVIGPNGAGKSTLFGVLSGEHRPHHGRILIDGRDVTSVPPNERVAMGIGRTFQVSRIFPNLTVLENVLAGVVADGGRATRFWQRIARGERDRARQMLAEVGLVDQADVVVLRLSQGDKKRLEIACALTLTPRVLLLDEPTAGMSLDETASTVRLLKDLWATRRISMILTEHDMSVIFGLSHTISVLHHGRLVCTGSPEEIRMRDDVREIYLGER